jgi:ubiquinone/menaquinone biosynthesis C-methylase UbiE
VVRGTADRLPFVDGSFRAVLSVNVLHNLDRERCIAALREIERLAPGRSYVQLDAYHTEAEREIFLAWVLTAVTFLKPQEWRELFTQAGYKGDYCWTILEANPEWNDFNACDPASANH